MAEELDYDAMVAQLQKELEEARLTILKLRHARNPLDHLDADKIRSFVQKNYLILLLSFMAFEVLFKVAMSLFTKRNGGTHGES